MDVSVRNLSKRFGAVRAVDDLSFEAFPGTVTGFLGPNGAGKTTTLRALVGLIRPTSGSALIGGLPYSELPAPSRTVGAVLDADGRPGRSGRNQLLVRAAATGVQHRRVDEVLEQVGLTSAAGRRVADYSTGMRQRLGLAAALLGEPEVLILDEPANGLDPEGIACLRSLLLGFAAAGGTVLIASHLLSEVAQTVDRVVIIAGGTLRFAGPLDQLGNRTVFIQVAEVERLAQVLIGAGIRASVAGPSAIEAVDVTTTEIGLLAAREGIALSGLSETAASLEEAFLRLTAPAVAAQPSSAQVPPGA